MMAAKRKQDYLGNPNLPVANAVFEYTPEMVDHIAKCENSLLYFAENFFYIIDPDEGKTIIPLFDYQTRLLESFEKNRFNIVLSSRQSGKCFSENTSIKVRNKKTGEIEDVNAVEFYNRVKK